MGHTDLGGITMDPNYSIDLGGLLQLDEPTGRQGGPARAQRRAQSRRAGSNKRRGQRAHRREQDKLTPEQREFQLLQMNRALFGEIGTPAMRRNLTRRIIGEVTILVTDEVDTDGAFAISPKASPTSERTQAAKRKRVKEIARRIDAKLVELKVDPEWAK